MLSHETEDLRETYSELLRIYAEIEVGRCQTLIYLHKLTSRVGLKFDLNHAMREGLSIENAIEKIVANH